MKLSIAIPVYNKAGYLSRCLESILSQNRKNYEIVIVNDGSTDSSLRIAREYQVRYPDIIRVVDNSNQGSLLARRSCINSSTGDYILIIDADDYLCDVEATQLIEDTINKTKCDLLIFNYKESNNNKVRICLDYPAGIMEKEFIFHKLTTDTSLLNPLFNKVFSRDIVDYDFDYEAHRSVGNGTDYYQVLPLLSNATRIFYIGNVLYCYCIVGNSIAHSFNPRVYSSLKAGYERLKGLSVNWQLEDKVAFDNEMLKRRLLIASTSAFKVRYCKEFTEAEKYLNKISIDNFFLDAYAHIKEVDLPLSRKMVLWLLKNKKYKALYIVSKCKHH